AIAVFDRHRPNDLAGLAPWLVIDAAGPFQDSGYELALAAIDGGAHHIDFADARTFVAGFPTSLDQKARARGVLAVTGASSTPALSHAALTPLVAGWTQIDETIVTISPGARSPRGLSVVKSILSYAGKPVRIFDEGEWRTTPGWSLTRRLSMPGLGTRWASLCETPDLDLLPARFPVRRSALFLAGLELTVLHLGLGLLCWPVRLKWVHSLRPLAKPLNAIAGLLCVFGSDRGGMIVEAAGLDPENRPIRARWSLTAKANAGPNVPVAAASALCKAILDKRQTKTGAFACVGLLTCEEILEELKHLPIETRVDESLCKDTSLFRRLIGRRFDLLPRAFRIVHDGRTDASFHGNAVVRIGQSLAARLITRIMNLPRPGTHRIEVRIAPGPDGETWTRTFGTASFRSCLSDAPRLGEFQEVFGPLRFSFDLQSSAAGVKWQFTGWSLLGLPVPRWAGPRMKAGAIGTGGRYSFSVVVNHPLTGLLFAYRGGLDAP
ncbi:MAG TPA: DUF4166 domain-containing protein, partial [Afipia sp.]